MPREENLLILKMLQEGTITAEQAAELLAALDSSAARAAPAAPAPPAPPPPPAPLDSDEAELGESGETFARARAKIAAAREKVAGVQERLAAAQERLGKAEGTSNPWEAVADALKDVPGARSVADALRGVDPGRIAATARRQARRVARSVRASLGDLNVDLNAMLGERRGEPTISVAREVSAPVAPGGTLRVRNPFGDIEAAGADIPEARVAGTLQIWAGSEMAAQSLAEQVSLSVTPGADGPTIAVTHPPEARHLRLDLKVLVPQGIKASLLSPAGDITARALQGGVAVATQSGDAQVQDVGGDVAVETASGDIVLDGVTGSVTASSASGTVTLARVSSLSGKVGTQSGDVELRETTIASVEIETVSGDVAAQAAEGRSLRIRTVSGDVEALDVAVREETHLDTVSGSLALAPRERLRTGTLTLAAVSGDVDLRLPATTDAALSLSSRSGDIHGAFRTADGEQRIDTSGLNSFTRTLGAGAGARVTVTTVSGDIVVNQTAA